MRYAGFWRRFTAYGIDGSIVQVLSFLVMWLLGSVAHAQTGDETLRTLIDAGFLDPSNASESLATLLGQSDTDDFFTGADFLIWLLISTVYNVWFLIGRWQATPGKHWCGLKVVTEQGEPITLTRAAMRWLASGVSWIPFGLGYFCIGFSRQKAAMHDAICGTRVIYRD